MRHSLPGILCALIAIAGWHYLFYSRAAHNLGAVERAKPNLSRIRLRRVNGFVLLLLAFTMFAGFYTFDQTRPTAFVVTWCLVMALLAIMVILASVDVWLTVRLRRERRKPPPGFPLQ